MDFKKFLMEVALGTAPRTKTYKVLIFLIKLYYHLGLPIGIAPIF